MEGGVSMYTTIRNEFCLLPKSKIKAGEGIDNGIFPFFTSSDIKVSSLNSYEYDDEIVVIGTGGKPSCNYVNGKFSFSTDNYALKAKGKIEPKFLYYFLRKDGLATLQNGFHGAGLQHISKDYILNIEIPMFGRSKQQTIVRVLDDIHGMILACQEQLTLLDELIKSRFIEMFGDPIHNTKKLQTNKVNNIVTLQRGYDLPNKQRNTEGRIPLFGANGQTDFHQYGRAKNGVITGRSGSIGNVYYCKGEFWPLNTTLFSKDTHGNNVIYLCYLLRFFDLARFSNGTGVPTLNRNLFKDEQIIDVPIDAQNRFADFVEQIDKSKFIVQERIKLYQELLNKKMDEYFN